MISLNPTSNRTARHLLLAETGGVSPLDENMQYQEKLASLKSDYQKMLPKRLEEISQAWKKVSRENSEDQLEELCRLVHSLAGSGATFGYSLLSSVAKETEVILRQIQEKKVELDTFRKTEVDGLLNDLSKATDTTDDTDASGAMEMARLRLGSRTMSQHIFWYGKDGSLAIPENMLAHGA